MIQLAASGTAQLSLNSSIDARSSWGNQPNKIGIIIGITGIISVIELFSLYLFLFLLMLSYVSKVYFYVCVCFVSLYT